MTDDRRVTKVIEAVNKKIIGRGKQKIGRENRRRILKKHKTMFTNHFLESFFLNDVLRFGTAFEHISGSLLIRFQKKETK